MVGNGDGKHRTEDEFLGRVHRPSDWTDDLHPLLSVPWGPPDLRKSFPLRVFLRVFPLRGVLLFTDTVVLTPLPIYSITCLSGTVE